MIKFLPIQAIEDLAESFLQKYHPEKSLPIPIEEILDLKFIVFDKDQNNSLQKLRNYVI